MWAVYYLSGEGILMTSTVFDRVYRSLRSFSALLPATVVAPTLGLGQKPVAKSEALAPNSGQLRQPLLTLGRLSQNDYYQCNRVLFSPDGTRLLSIGENEKVVVWDSLTGKELLTIPVGSEQTGAFALTPDGRRLATAHYGMVRIWDAQSGRAVLQLPMDRKYVAVCLAFSPIGRYLAAPTRNGSVTLWELATGQQTLIC